MVSIIGVHFIFILMKPKETILWPRLHLRCSGAVTPCVGLQTSRDEDWTGAAGDSSGVGTRQSPTASSISFYSLLYSSSLNLFLALVIVIESPQPNKQNSCHPVSFAYSFLHILLYCLVILPKKLVF